MESEPSISTAAAAGLIPSGDIGFLGRDLDREERGTVLEDLYFENDRRVPYLYRYTALMVFSAGIAALGLMNDSAAVVIGAMLVAPLMTPIMAFASAVIQTWSKRAFESFVIVATGAFLAIAVGWLTSLIIPRIGPDSPLPEQVLARTSPNLADLGIALLAGAAGAYVTVRTEAGSALPGVGIAVALVPPLATVGITLGAGRGELALGALLLFITNFAAITLAAGLMFAFAGFVPPRERFKQRALGVTITAVLVLAVAIPLGFNSYVKVERSEAEVVVVRAVRDWDPALEVQKVVLDDKTDPLTVLVVVSGTSMEANVNDLANEIVRVTDEAIELQLLFEPVTIVTATP